MSTTHHLNYEKWLEALRQEKLCRRSGALPATPCCDRSPEIKLYLQWLMLNVGFSLLVSAILVLLLYKAQLMDFILPMPYGHALIAMVLAGFIYMKAVVFPVNKRNFVN